MRWRMLEVRRASRLSGLRPKPATPSSRIRERPGLDVRRLGPQRLQGRAHLLAVGADMMQGLHENDRRMRLVRASIQKRQPLSVDWLLQKALPPRATLLGTGDQLIQVARFLSVRCSLGAAPTQTRHVARIRQHEMIQSRDDASKTESWARQLVSRAAFAGSDERLHGPEFVLECFEQDRVHRHATSV